MRTSLGNQPTEEYITDCIIDLLVTAAHQIPMVSSADFYPPQAKLNLTHFLLLSS